MAGETEATVSEVRQALYRGDRAAADALIAAGATPNIFDAASLGDARAVREMIDADPSLVHAWSADGFTALHFAAFLGGPDAVRGAGRRGCRRGRGRANAMLVQPLHSAAAHGNVESCRLLLDAGADPNARQQGDFRPIDEAIHTDNAALIALLRERGADDNDVSVAVRASSGTARTVRSNAIGRRLGVVDLGPGVVEERVLRARMHVQRGVLAQARAAAPRARGPRRGWRSRRARRTRPRPWPRSPTSRAVPLPTE